MDKLLGFAPDLPPDTPGVWTDCANIIPYETGFQGAPTGVATTAPALASDCRGAAVMQKLDDTRRLFAGTQTKLYELVSSAWTDRSAGGGSYAGSVDSRWSFAQFGDTAMATNLVDAMQSSSTGAFAAIATAPKAKIIVSAANNFVIAFNTSEGVYGVQPDRWWCCAQNDQTTWTPSVSTGATTGRLIATPGSVTAALPLGDYVVAYKLRGVYLGSFVGAAAGSWQWPLVPGSSDCGAVGQEAVCDMGGVHFIVGADDFWLFDGTRPVSIGEEVRAWFKANSSETYRYRTRCTFDRARNLVWIHFPSKGSTGAVDSTLAYHTRAKRFGVANVTMEAALNYIAPGTTIDGLDAYASTIDTLPAVPFDSSYWQGSGRIFAYFDSTHRLVVNSGACGASSFTTGDFGDDEVVTGLDAFRVRYLQSPTTANAAGFTKMDSGGTLTPGPVENRYNARFDVRQAGYWHRLKISMTGDHRETGQQADLSPEGAR